MLGESREQRARIVWRRLGQSVVLSFSLPPPYLLRLVSFAVITLHCAGTAPLPANYGGVEVPDFGGKKKTRRQDAPGFWSIAFPFRTWSIS